MFGGRKPDLEEARNASTEKRGQYGRLLDALEQLRNEAADNSAQIERLEEGVVNNIGEQEANAEQKSEAAERAEGLRIQIEKIKAELASELTAIEGLDKAAETLEKKKLDIEQNIESTKSQREKLAHTFKTRQSSLATVAQEIAVAAKVFRKARFEGPEKEAVKPVVSEAADQPQQIVSLGDVHGWAPGLIRHLTEGGHASVEIAGRMDIGNDAGAMESIFNNPLTAMSASRPLPRVGLDGHLIRSKSTVTSFHEIVTTWKHPGTGPRYVQIGDLIDRGDHSELAVEMMRQACLTSSGRALVLMGNHEEIVIEGVFQDWVSNERKFLMDATKQRPGVISHDVKITGAPSPEKSFSSNFQAMEGCIGSLLLSQHIVLYDNLDDEGQKWLEELMKPTWKALKCDLKTIRSWVDKGGWHLHERGWNMLSKLRKASKKKKLHVPGALVSWYESGCLLIHAEPNGLADVDEEILSQMKISHQFGGGQARFSLMSLKDGRATSKPLCWARGAEEMQGGDRVAKVGIERFSSAVAPILVLIHGHTPRAHELRYEVVTEHGTTEVINIDEGMTPVYHFDAGGEDAYDPMRVPAGVTIDRGDFID